MGTAALACAVKATAQSAPPPFVTIKNSEIHYVEKENGIRSAVIYGDPDKPGYYITRNIFPAGVMSTPHSHDQDRFVTVIRGTWYAGTNANWDTSETIAMPTGSTMFHPKGAVHYDGSLVEETEVQIIGMGPVKTDYIYKSIGKYGKPHKMTP
jgi:quercetin dioxygenase-like cupin family protein